MMPNATKSVAMTTIVMMKVRVATMAARRAPKNPEPRARRKAMNARPVAMGWRIMTRVRAFAVSADAVEKVVPSTWAMIKAGL